MRLTLLLFTVLIVFSALGQDSTLIDSVVPLDYEAFEMPFENNAVVESVTTLNNNQLTNQNLFWILLIICLAIVVLRNVARNYTSMLLQSNFNLNHAIQMARAERSSDRIYSILYFLIFLSLITVIVSLVAQIILGVQFHWHFIFVVSLFYMLYEFAQINIAGFLVEQKVLTQTIQYNLLAHILLSLIVLLPFAALLIFGPSQIRVVVAWITLAILAVAYVLKELRFVQLILAERMKVPILYFFLYICTFKFLPILLIAKAIKNVSFN